MEGSVSTINVFDGDTDDLGNRCRCIILRISTSAYYQKYVWSWKLWYGAIVYWLYKKKVKLSNRTDKNYFFMIKMLTLLIGACDIFFYLSHAAVSYMKNMRFKSVYVEYRKNVQTDYKPI